MNKAWRRNKGIFRHSRSQKIYLLYTLQKLVEVFRAVINKIPTDCIKGLNARFLTEFGFFKSYTDKVPSCSSSHILMPQSVKDHFTPQSSYSALVYTWGLNISQRVSWEAKIKYRPATSPWLYNFRLPEGGPTAVSHTTPTVRSPISHNFLMTFSTDFTKRVLQPLKSKSRLDPELPFRSRSTEFKLGPWSPFSWEEWWQHCPFLIYLGLWLL